MNKAFLLLVSVLVACGGNSAAPATATIEPTFAVATSVVPTSTPTQLLIIGTPTSEPAASPPVLVATMKGDPNPFLNPTGLAVDRQDNLYVVDGANARIQKFDRNGQFITLWGSRGTGDSQFCFLEGRFAQIAIDSQSNVYIADYCNTRVQKFNSDGKFLAKWGSKGKDDGQFLEPFGVAVNSEGNVYVIDEDVTNARVQKFDANGKFLTKWGSFGAGNGQFGDTDHIAVDPQGNVYVTDYGNSRVQKFDANGKFLTTWNRCGEQRPQMTPANLAFDTHGSVYITDFENSRVCEFDRNGQFITTWGGPGSGDNQLNKADGIAVDVADNIYVADTFNNRVEKFHQP